MLHIVIGYFLVWQAIKRSPSLPHDVMLVTTAKSETNIFSWPGRIFFLGPAVTVGETEGAMDSTSVFFAYNFVRK